MGTVLAVALCWAFTAGPAAGDTLLVEDFRFGSFESGTRLLVRPSGETFVTDAGLNRIFQFDTPRKEPRSAGGFGWLPGSFDFPNGVASDGVNTYVSDRRNHRIQRLDRRLAPVAALSTRDTTAAEARFGYPAGVALTGFGDLLILDGENGRLLKFTGAAQFDPSFGAASAARTRLAEPVDVEVLPGNVVVVADRGRLLFLDQFGNELGISTHPWLKNVRGIGAASESIVAVTDDGLAWFLPDGTPVRELPWTRAVFSAPTGTVYDVAVAGDTVYLLTANCVVSCSLHGQ